MTRIIPKNTKNKYIWDMAATILGKPSANVTAPQYHAAKALFFSLAYDADPSVVALFTERLKAS